MTTQSYNQLTFDEVATWLLQNGDNKAVVKYYGGIRFNNPSHRRDAEAILTAFVKLRQRNEAEIVNSVHRSAFNGLEADIVDFCSQSLMAPQSDIKHPKNSEVYKKFQALVKSIKAAKPLFLEYGLTQQIGIRNLFKSGYFGAGTSYLQEKIQQAATTNAINLLFEDPQSLKNKIMGLSNDAKRQLLNLLR